MPRVTKQPTDKDTYTCPHCGGSVKHRAPYIYQPRKISGDDIQVIDTWNVPYSTGLYILAKDDVPEERVAEFANEKAHFDAWPLQRLGVLWSKETWDD